MEVARAGERTSPPLPVPAGLRPFLGFRRLTGPALDATRRVLDEDGAFRDRVAAAVAVGDVGEAGWLFLARPDGWQERLSSLLAGADREAVEVRAEAEARSLRREVDRLRRELDDQAAALRSARAGAEQAAEHLERERHARQQARAQVQALEARLEGVAAERAAAIRDLKETERRFVARTEEARALREAVERAEQARARAEADLAARAESGPAAGPEAPVVPDVGPDGPDLAEVGRAVGRASAAAAALGEALGVARDALAPPSAPPAPAGPRESSDPPPPRRRPAPLPPGVLEDSPAAAAALLRSPGMLLVVDGYNVSLPGWPGLALVDQRARLVSALAEATARTGADALVVFDGADTGAGLPGESRPRGVQVRFTAPGVEADDEILALLDALPGPRPVTVASSDRRVVDGARARGAATVGADQLLAVLRA